MKIILRVVLLVLVAGLIIATGCTTSTDFRDEQEQTPVPTTELPPQVSPPQPTYSPIQTPTGPPEVAIFKPLIVEYESNLFEITVKDYERGSYADDQISRASKSNPAPAANFEYVIIEVSVRCVKGEIPVYIDQGDFAIYIGNKKVAAWTESIVLPSGVESFDAAYMQNGDSETGWMVFEVPEDKDIRLAFEPEIYPLGFITI